MIRAALAAMLLAFAVPAQAEFITSSTEGSFEDVSFAVENAIIGKGLVIDSVSHVGDMLERTKGDVGASATIFTKANIYLFCSASVSRKVMEADPMNIQFCPYGISVYERPDASGRIEVGYRAYPEGAMQDVQDLLATIVADAIGN